MVSHVRTLMVLASGDSASVAGLPDLAQLAAALGARLAVVHLLAERDVAAADSRRIADALPADPHVAVLAVPADQVAATLDALHPTAGDIVALQPERPGGLVHALAGTSYERLLRSGELPVLALPPSGHVPPIRRVLFAADFAARSKPALERTIALCQQLAAELHVLHVFGEDRPLPGEQDGARRTATNPAELLQLDQAALAEIVAQVRAAGLTSQSHTGDGQEHQAILACAAANAADLIVLASHGPRSTADILRGSTTARVVHSAQVPVLAFPA